MTVKQFSSKTWISIPKAFTLALESHAGWLEAESVNDLLEKAPIYIEQYAERTDLSRRTQREIELAHRLLNSEKHERIAIAKEIRGRELGPFYIERMTPVFWDFLSSQATVGILLQNGNILSPAGGHFLERRTNNSIGYPTRGRYFDLQIGIIGEFELPVFRTLRQAIARNDHLIDEIECPDTPYKNHELFIKRDLAFTKFFKQPCNDELKSRGRTLDLRDKVSAAWVEHYPNGRGTDSWKTVLTKIESTIGQATSIDTIRRAARLKK